MGDIHETNGLQDFVKDIELTPDDIKIVPYDEVCMRYKVCKDTHSIGEFPIRHLMSKHIIVDSGKASRIKEIAIKNSHANIKWGNLRGGTVETENEIINKMIRDDFMRPMRVTITTRPKVYRSGYPCVWSDNNHTAISYMRRGFKKIQDVPCYIVDVTRYSKHPIQDKPDKILVFAPNPDNIGPIEDVLIAARQSLRLQLFVNNGGYEKYRWDLENLEEQLEER